MHANVYQRHGVGCTCKRITEAVKEHNLSIRFEHCTVCPIIPTYTTITSALTCKNRTTLDNSAILHHLLGHFKGSAFELLPVFNDCISIYAFKLCS